MLRASRAIAEAKPGISRTLRFAFSRFVVKLTNLGRNFLQMCNLRSPGSFFAQNRDFYQKAHFLQHKGRVRRRCLLSPTVCSKHEVFLHLCHEAALLCTLGPEFWGTQKSRTV